MRDELSRFLKVSWHLSSPRAEGGLGGEVETDTQLVTAGGEILNVRHGGKRQFHARFQYLTGKEDQMKIVNVQASRTMAWGFFLRGSFEP